MKTGSLLLTVAGSLVLLLPAVASAQTPQDSVVGAGSVDQDGASQVTINVKSGPAGQTPGGDVSFRLQSRGPVIHSSSIDCLVVSGDTATLSGTWAPNPYGMTHFRIVAVDAGTAPTGPDLLGMVSTSNAPFNCPQDAANLPRIPLVTGGLTVRDARPGPASKKDCKNGGWRNYGTRFKNQGQCVSFVERTGCRKQRGTIGYRDPRCTPSLRP